MWGRGVARRTRAAASAMGHPRRGDRRRAPLPLSRPSPGRGALVLPAGVHREAHRPPRALQAQHPPPAPDRRPGVAARDQEVPAPHPGRRLAEGDHRRTELRSVRRRWHAPRWLLHPGTDARPRGVRRGTPRHDHARDRDAGARAGRPRGLPGAVVHRRAVRGVDQVGRARRHLLPERADLRVPARTCSWR